VQSIGINVANSFSFLAGESINKDEVINSLGLPIFIKPARSGSSVGISKVSKVEDFDAAIEKAFITDNRILIEEFIDGREMACGMFLKNDKLVVLPLTEIISKNDFFDYEAKYTNGMADEVSPPVNLGTEQEIDIKALSSLLYNKLDCRGIVRVDYILTNNELYFIEINTVPGLSPASIVPKQAEAMGIPIGELFNTVVENMFP
jgi:D-alanine-D-alanine ligase